MTVHDRTGMPLIEDGTENGVALGNAQRRISGRSDDLTGLTVHNKQVGRFYFLFMNPGRRHENRFMALDGTDSPSCSGHPSLVIEQAQEPTKQFGLTLLRRGCSHGDRTSNE